MRSQMQGKTLAGRKDPAIAPKHPDNFDWWGAFRSEYWKRRNAACFANGGTMMSNGDCMPLPAIGCGLVALPVRTWPSTAGEMDELLKMPGKQVPDGPTTPGRGKIEWRPSDKIKIIFEQHPYHPNSPPKHSRPHWHLDTPGKPHIRYLPGDKIP